MPDYPTTEYLIPSTSSPGTMLDLWAEHFCYVDNLAARNAR